MSRSVIMPTRRSFSPTGIAPALISSMIFATSRMLCPGAATRTSRVIASLTRIFRSFPGLLPPGTEQEINRHRERGYRDSNTRADRERGRRKDEERRLRGERLGRRHGEEQHRRDQRPAPDVGHEHPAHGAVVGARALAREPRPAGGVLEEQEWVEVEGELARERQPRAALAQQQRLGFSDFSRHGLASRGSVAAVPTTPVRADYRAARTITVPPCLTQAALSAAG